jgi:hypothetical protein
MTLVAGPFVGGASGEVVARVLLRIGSELEERVFAPREQRRIGLAYAAAAQSAEARLAAGERVRSDGFFDAEEGASSPAEEMLEGVLRSAADAWEERKAPYVGRLFSGMAFQSDVTVGEGSYLVRLVDRLTYRQLLLLAAFHDSQAGGAYEREMRGLSGGKTPTQHALVMLSLIAEMDELMAANLIGLPREDGSVGPPDATIIGSADAGSLRSSDVTKIRVTPMGGRLYSMLGLDEVPAEDVASVFAAIADQT